jgi:hypothetical protein
MSAGTGLFLGLACIAMAYLYVQTKDRWRWRTIGKCLAALVALPIVVVVMWLGFGYVKAKLHARPKPVTKYADISLGDTKSEVLYAKGPPTNVLIDDKSSDFPFPGVRTDIALADLKAGETVRDYKYWSYDSSDAGRIDIDFSPKSQEVVRIYCYGSTGHPCPSLLGVPDGATEDEVLSRLGPPGHAEIDNGWSAVKTLSYPNWNVTFQLDKRQVYGLRIDAP